MEGQRERRRWKQNKKAADPSRFLELHADGTAAAVAEEEEAEEEEEEEEEGQEEEEEEEEEGHKPAAKARHYLDFT